MYKKKIISKRINLKFIEDKDLQDIFAMFSNPNVVRWTKAKTHTTIQKTEALISNTLKEFDESHIWSIRNNGEQQVIGLMHFLVSSSDTAEIHYVLAENFWNKGLMTEAIEAIIIWTKEKYPHLHKIYTEAIVENIGSCRVLEKCGFKKVNSRCVRWNKFYPHFVDLFCYELRLD